jgi:hypothetical protein
MRYSATEPKPCASASKASWSVTSRLRLARRQLGELQLQMSRQTGHSHPSVCTARQQRRRLSSYGSRIRTSSASSTLPPMRFCRQDPHHVPRPLPPAGARSRSAQPQCVFRSAVFCLEARQQRHRTWWVPSPGRAAPAEVAGGAGFAAALMAQFRAGDLGLLASPGLDALQLFQVLQVPVGVVLTDRKSQGR